MKKSLALLVLLTTMSLPTQAAEDMWRASGQACAFGAAVLGLTSFIVLTPALAAGATTMPVTSLILGNAILGCGVSAIGAGVAHGFGAVYDGFAERNQNRSEPCPASPPASPRPAN